MKEQLFRKVECSIRQPKKSGYFDTNMGTVYYMYPAKVWVEDGQFATVISNQHILQHVYWWLEPVDTTDKISAEEWLKNKKWLKNEINISKVITFDAFSCTDTDYAYLGNILEQYANYKNQQP